MENTKRKIQKVRVENREGLKKRRVVVVDRKEWKERKRGKKRGVGIVYREGWRERKRGTNVDRVGWMERGKKSEGEE